MRLLLDSSFFFPLIGVAVSQFSKEAILELVSKEEIIRSELVIFELSAKGSKLINSGELTINKLTRGITAIYNHQEIIVVPIHHSEIQSLTCELRKKHSDFIDCLVVATAVYYADRMLTLDEELKKKMNEEWKEIIESINKEFEIISWREYKKK